MKTRCGAAPDCPESSPWGMALVAQRSDVAAPKARNNPGVINPTVTTAISRLQRYKNCHLFPGPMAQASHFAPLALGIRKPAQPKLHGS
jgi:hypothetical protein